MSGAGMTVLIVLVVLAVLVAIGLAVRPWLRRRRLQDRFGPEYDRAVQESESRRAAEQELTEREKRHSQLQLRELSEDEKARYGQQWAHVQEQFIDDPVRSLDNADRLLVSVMSDRGYPTEDFQQQLADLSVRHAAPLEQFRTAHEIAGRAASGQASTEDMRAAIVHYRELFVDVLDGNRAGQTAPNK
ncbi:hypothetical protein [Nocardia sp. NPDC005978]|uniref:hypothetical protein n=1 Tax=unclassified Nocardia TaxID=2637762 RepID=UPI0033A42F59